MLLLHLAFVHWLCSKVIKTSLFKVVKLSVDHIVGANEDEELRLRQLGLSHEDIDRGLSDQGYTRCLGYHRGKGGYKDEPHLTSAKDEPVLADPEVHGGIALEPTFQFLLLFSRSVTDCLSQVASTEGGDFVRELCRITLEQFSENTTVTGVAQAVVHKVSELFQTSSGQLRPSWNYVLSKFIGAYILNNSHLRCCP